MDKTDIPYKTEGAQEVHRKRYCEFREFDTCFQCQTLFRISTANTRRRKKWKRSVVNKNDFFPEKNACRARDISLLDDSL